MKKTISIQQKQQGAALVVGLIVLLIMTLLGITSMSTTTAELKMANNLQTQNYAFQAAETAGEMLVETASAAARISTINWASNNTTSIPNIAGVPIATGTVDVDAEVKYVGCSNAPMGYELGSGMEGSGGNFKGLVHDVDVTATMLGASNIAIGQAKIVMGVQTIRPGCPDVLPTPTVETI